MVTKLFVKELRSQPHPFRGGGEGIYEVTSTLLYHVTRMKVQRQ